MTDWTDATPAEKLSVSSSLPSTRTIALPVLAGLLLAAFGAAFVYFGLDYRLGTLRSMGPGMFPVAGGALLVLLGLGAAWVGRRSAERIDTVALRPLLATLASVVIFALLIERAGLAIAAPILVGGVVLATGQGSWKFALAIALPLTAAAIIVFPYLLGVPLKVLP